MANITLDEYLKKCETALINSKAALVDRMEREKNFCYVKCGNVDRNGVCTSMCLNKKSMTRFYEYSQIMQEFDKQKCIDRYYWQRNHNNDDDDY